MIKREPKGFTLIEMMLVVTIIGVLVALVMIVVINSRKRANATVVKGHISQISRALDMYVTDGCSGQITVKQGESIEGPASCTGTVYLQKVPLEPINSIKYYACNSGNPASSKGELSLGASINPSDYCVKAEGFANGEFFACVNGSCFCTPSDGCEKTK
ncbi:MAG: prepilin-type N-terminal cleavage/methylation domain-containing protein [Candidatus Moranbacteria bacterium]|nr:prepilin-type N-terminal cleavage/methylation domain-containing protein [Candidatus Moranbacteria bacterium]